MPVAPPNQQNEPAHADWVGRTWDTNATDIAAVLASLQPDLLMLDHYAIDQRWEEAVAPHHKKLMVIDDLVDRVHMYYILFYRNLVKSVAASHQGHSVRRFNHDFASEWTTFSIAFD